MTTENLEPVSTPRKTKRIRSKECGAIRRRKWKTRNGNPSEAWQADMGLVNGSRRMRSFDTKADAENWLAEQRLLLKEQGHAAYELTDRQRVDAIRALEILEPVSGLPSVTRLEAVAAIYRECQTVLKDAGVTMQDAARFWLKHHPIGVDHRTVSQLADEYIADAVEHNLRPKTVQDLRYALNKLITRVGSQAVPELMRPQIDDWLARLTLAPKTKKRLRVICHGLYQFALDKNYTTAENPFQTNRLRRKYHEDEPMPECMPWGNVQSVMFAAAEYENTMVPGLAIGFFAGLRTNELTQLTWDDVNFDTRRITVKAVVAKKRRTRHVSLNDCLLAWLLPYRKEGGLIAPDGQKWRSRLDHVREIAGVPWPHNAMRHSFASHHLMKHNDAARTALELGHHRDTSMLFEHYRALVTPEDATSYFAIRPPASASKTILLRIAHV